MSSLSSRLSPATQQQQYSSVYYDQHTKHCRRLSAHSYTCIHTYMSYTQTPSNTRGSPRMRSAAARHLIMYAHTVLRSAQSQRISQCHVLHHAQQCCMHPHGPVYRITSSWSCPAHGTLPPSLPSALACLRRGGPAAYLHATATVQVRPVQVWCSAFSCTAWLSTKRCVGPPWVLWQTHPSERSQSPPVVIRERQWGTGERGSGHDMHRHDCNGVCLQYRDLFFDGAYFRIAVVLCTANKVVRRAGHGAIMCNHDAVM